MTWHITRVWLDGQDAEWTYPAEVRTDATWNGFPIVRMRSQDAAEMLEAAGIDVEYVGNLPGEGSLVVTTPESDSETLPIVGHKVTLHGYTLNTL